MSISLCMITKNEEACLERVLRSIQNVVTEIVIVDTGSTDKTKEIAKKFTNKIYDFSWVDDFSAARNESIRYATSDWILILDADETIASTDHQLLLDLVGDDADAFLMTQRTYTNISTALNFVSSSRDQYSESKPYLGWTSTKIIRLFRNKKGYLFSGRIHESVLSSIQRKNSVIKEVNLPIHHFSIEKGSLFLESKKPFYKKLGELKLRDHPQDVDALYEMAKRVLMEKKFLEAKELLEQARVTTPTFPKTYPLLIYVHAELGDLAKAEEAFSLAKKYGSDSRSSILTLAIAYERCKNYDAAINLIYKYEFQSTDFVPLLSLLGNCFFKKQDYATACAFFEKILTLDANNIKAQSFLIERGHPRSEEFKSFLKKNNI